MKKLSILIFFIALVGIMPSLLQYGAFVMAKDFATQQVPFIIETKRLLASGAPFWSWNTFTGADAIGSYSFYTLTSPFVWFACLFPYKFILQGITLVLFLKFLCAGWASYAFLRKMDVSSQASVLGALMYAFSSYAVSNIGYYHFMEPMICFPLLLLGVEKFLRDEKWGNAFLAGTVFLTAFVNYYFLPGSLICAGLYGVFRMFSPDSKPSLGLCLKAVFWVGAGVLMAAAVLVPSVMMMEGNPRVSASSVFWLTSSLERFRTLLTPQLLEKINPLLQGSGWNSHAAHLPVVGILLATLYGIRHRDWLTWLCVLTILLYLSPLNGIFTLFTNPLYTRWAYALVLFLILASVKYLDEGGKVKGWELAVYILIVLGVTAFHYFYSNIAALLNGTFSVDGMTLADNVMVLLSVIASVVLLLVWSRDQTARRLTGCVVVASLLCLPARIWMETDSFFKLGGMESDPGLNKIGYIHKYLIHNNFPENADVFSGERTDFVTRDRNIYQNVGMLKNRPSVESYNSAAYHRTAPLFSMADTVRSGAFSWPNKFQRSFDALLSVKEVVVYDDPIRTPSRDLGYLVEREARDGYSVYENPDFIPMGFSYDSYVRESALDSLIGSTVECDVASMLLTSLSVKDEDIPKVESCLTEGSISRERPDLDSLVALRRASACYGFKGTTRGFTAKVDADGDRVVFFSVPHYRGFKALVDGVPTEILKVNFGQMAVKVGKGSHEIEFKYYPAGLKAGMALAAPSWLVFILCLFWRRKDE